jgi:hypothetical protein
MKRRINLKAVNLEQILMIIKKQNLKIYLLKIIALLQQMQMVLIILIQ